MSAGYTKHCCTRGTAGSIDGRLGSQWPRTKRPYWPRIVAFVIDSAHRSIQALTIHFHSDYERGNYQLRLQTTTLI